jgi:hypothetical protein
MSTPKLKQLLKETFPIGGVTTGNAFGFMIPKSEMHEEKEKYSITGGEVDRDTIQDLARKHMVDFQVIVTQIGKGIEAEKEEHNVDVDEAIKIAVDHLNEDPYYYSKLGQLGLEEDHGDSGKTLRTFINSKYRKGNFTVNDILPKEKEGEAFKVETPSGNSFEVYFGGEGIKDIESIDIKGNDFNKEEALMYFNQKGFPFARAVGAAMSGQDEGVPFDQFQGLNESNDFQPGQSVTVNNAKKYDIYQPDVTSGVIEYVGDDGKIHVKVDGGMLTVDPVDLVVNNLNENKTMKANKRILELAGIKEMGLSTNDESPVVTVKGVPLQIELNSDGTYVAFNDDSNIEFTGKGNDLEQIRADLEHEMPDSSDQRGEDEMGLGNLNESKTMKANKRILELAGIKENYSAEQEADYQKYRANIEAKHQAFNDPKNFSKSFSELVHDLWQQEEKEQSADQPSTELMEMVEELPEWVAGSIKSGVPPQLVQSEINKFKAELQSRGDVNRISPEASVMDVLNQIESEVLGKSQSINEELSHEDLKKYWDAVLSGKMSMETAENHLAWYAASNQGIADMISQLKHELARKKEKHGNQPSSINESLTMKNKVTKHKPHPKNLISEAAFAMVGGIVPIKPIGGLVSSAPVSKDVVNEVSSDLAKSELFYKLPLLNQGILMELSEHFIGGASGKNWGKLVEELGEEYYANPTAKEAITNELKRASLI